jgi:DNA topoisomerase-1
VEYDFTAGLEDQLDRVSNNELGWRDLLREFWNDFTGAVDGIKDLRIGEVLTALDDMLAPHIYPARADGGDPRQCPLCGTGRLSLKIGKFGAFIGCSNYPECRNTRQLAAANGDGAVENGAKELGIDPATGLPVTLRSGRFGPYVQLGEGKDGEKPKRAGLLKGTDPNTVTLELALKLLSLPRNVGKHPDDGEPILAGVGRFGPYVQHGKTYASLEPGDDVLTVGLNRAVTLIAEKIAKGPRARRFGADPGRALGEHPKGGPIVAKNGRYGPYVSHNGVNATLPNDKTPDTITLDEAIALIDARAAKIDGAPVRRASRRKTRTAREAAAPTVPVDAVAEPKPARKRAARPARPKPAVKAAEPKPKAPARRARTARQ